MLEVDFCARRQGKLTVVNMGPKPALATLAGVLVQICARRQRTFAREGGVYFARAPESQPFKGKTPQNRRSHPLWVGRSSFARASVSFLHEEEVKREK